MYELFIDTKINLFINVDCLFMLILIIFREPITCTLCDEFNKFCQILWDYFVTTHLKLLSHHVYIIHIMNNAYPININQSNDNLIITEITATRIPSESEFKNKSFCEKWKEYTTLYYENHNLQLRLQDANMVNSSIRNINKNLTTQIAQLSKDNESLNNKIEMIATQLHDQKQLTQLIDTLKNENNELKMKISTLEANNLQLELKIANQNIKIAEQDINISILKKDNNDLKFQGKKQCDDIKELRQNIIELQQRDDPFGLLRRPITCREAMKALEGHIMFEILGSKRKMNKYNNVCQLFDDNRYSTECNNFLTNHSITDDHIDLIVDLKKKGNNSAHANRPLIERSLWDQIIIDALPDPNDANDISKAKDILKLLENYFPVLNNGCWNIQKV